MDSVEARRRTREVYLLLVGSTRDLFHLFACPVINRVGISAADHERALFAMEAHAEAAAIQTIAIGAQSFPGDLLSSVEFEVDDLRIRSFPVVAEMKTSPDEVTRIG